ncbi:hypothetical protein AAZX31_03G135500 [Glycine max]|uniref:FAF domain-containing protein n=2 Tax=Glycine subgen. Soja TaxID=1462606 RepID=I1JNU1_SOYBN|nr:hypothetical protein JHK86_007569 [Glycine max]KAH1258291.1 Protein FANTASTIC FOUR 1 [Glycine max]KHN19892.1 Protein FANTASTIC FOUR 1 [Glycine soja]KRH67200.1 hypothetical protein GLYMA_03G153400v4 [Glycine max]RZC20814.1 Protein FANTASTIC FOUR 1 [Glycine soja]
MSSSSVCQGLQSCLEPRVMEPRILRLKLSLQQGSNFPQSSPSPTNNTNTISLSPLSDSEENPLTNHECDKNNTKSDLASGWSLVQTLSHNKTEDQVYVHPTVKRSSSILSEKSLEMCTESLGSETGSNASDSGDDMSLFSSDTNTCSTEHTTTTTVTVTVTTHASYMSKRVNRTCNFPPPLTTITGFGGVHVRPLREGGRLILEAVASPSPSPYFHAERGDGRLRLCLFEGFSASDDDDDVCEGVDDQEEEEEKKNENEENREEEEEKEEKECGEEDITSGAEEEEECVENVEDEMGVKKLARPSRCKESGKGDIFGDALANLSFPRFLCL